jgi:hypothetical protein
MTLFWGNYNYQPVMQFKAPKYPPSLRFEILAHTFAAALQETHQILRKTLQEAQANHLK